MTDKDTFLADIENGGLASGLLTSLTANEQDVLVAASKEYMGAPFEENVSDHEAAFCRRLHATERPIEGKWHQYGGAASSSRSEDGELR